MAVSYIKFEECYIVLRIFYGMSGWDPLWNATKYQDAEGSIQTA